jgi:hypothetical protein
MMPNSLLLGRWGSSVLKLVVPKVELVHGFGKSLSTHGLLVKSPAHSAFAGFSEAA